MKKSIKAIAAVSAALALTFSCSAVLLLHSVQKSYYTFHLHHGIR